MKMDELPGRSGGTAGKIGRGLLVGCVVLQLFGCAEGSHASSTWTLSEKDLPAIEPRIGFVDSVGHELTTDEVVRANGRVAWTIEDEDGVPAAAVAQVRAGMDAGSSGDFKRAIEHFREAHRLVPRWTQPVYQGAWTALLLGDAALAETLYAWTDRMVPRGYWTAKTAVDCLRRERAKEFPAGTYIHYVSLESESDNDRRRGALEELVKRSPGFAPAWKDLSVLRAAPEDRLEAVERGLLSRPDRETRGFLLIQKAQLLEDRGKRDAAAALLRSLLDPEVGTLQSASLAKVKLIQLDARER